MTPEPNSVGMMAAVNICADCRYYQPGETNIYNVSLARCAHPKYIDLVTGKPGELCAHIRQSWLGCGRKGCYWEPREAT
jgi:hypothetical protein